MSKQKAVGNVPDKEKNIIRCPLCNAPCSCAENDQCSMCGEETSILENGTYERCGTCIHYAFPDSLSTDQTHSEKHKETSH